MQNLLDEEEARGEDDDSEDSDVDDEWKDLFAKPIVGKKAETPVMEESNTASVPATPTTIPPSSSITTTTSLSTSTPSQMTTTQPPTLRNRNPTTTTTKPAPTSSQLTTATTTATSISTNLNPTLPTKESALSASRLEQEDLTTSLLSLASQLKASSQSFQATLENEKSILDRAVTGIDKTSSTMEAAGQRMGMLRRMTEGKGWWGRMMLYAWVFGLWVVAVLIVFVGPKLRF